MSYMVRFAPLGALVAASTAHAALVTVGTHMVIDYSTKDYFAHHLLNLDVDFNGSDDVGFGWYWTNTFWEAIGGGPFLAEGDNFPDITPGAHGVVNLDADDRGVSGLTRRLKNGEAIGPDLAPFLSGDSGPSQLATEFYVPPNMSDHAGEFFAPFHDRRRGFVGFAFEAGADEESGAGLNWGWVDLTVDHRDPFNGRIVIHGWGFETNPGATVSAFPIPAPGGAMLAAGGLFLGLSRARRPR